MKTQKEINDILSHAAHDHGNATAIIEIVAKNSLATSDLENYNKILNRLKILEDSFDYIYNNLYEKIEEEEKSESSFS